MEQDRRDARICVPARERRPEGQGFLGLHSRTKRCRHELRAIAALRLAGLLLDEKQFDQALKVLDGKVPEAFIPLYADRRGDIYVAQNKMQEARKEFRLALEKLKEDTNLRQIVEIKLDALGEV